MIDQPDLLPEPRGLEEREVVHASCDRPDLIPRTRSRGSPPGPHSGAAATAISRSSARLRPDSSRHQRSYRSRSAGAMVTFGRRQLRQRGLVPRRRSSSARQVESGRRPPQSPQTITTTGPTRSATALARGPPSGAVPRRDFVPGETPPDAARDDRKAAHPVSVVAIGRAPGERGRSRRDAAPRWPGAGFGRPSAGPQGAPSPPGTSGATAAARVGCYASCSSSTCYRACRSPDML